jgi:hypothetical protein
MNKIIYVVCDYSECYAFQSESEMNREMQHSLDYWASCQTTDELFDYTSHEIDLDELSTDDLEILNISIENPDCQLDGITPEQNKYIACILKDLDHFNYVYDLYLKSPDEDCFKIFSALKNAMENGNDCIRIGRSEHNKGQLLVSTHSEQYWEQYYSNIYSNINQRAGAINGEFQPVSMELDMTSIRQFKQANVKMPFKWQAKQYIKARG